MSQHDHPLSSRTPAEAPKGQCPHGENCACAIMTRHEWHVAFCEKTDEFKYLAKRFTALRDATTPSASPEADQRPPEPEILVGGPPSPLLALYETDEWKRAWPLTWLEELKSDVANDCDDRIIAIVARQYVKALANVPVAEADQPQEETPTREWLMKRVAFYAGECERQGAIIDQLQQVAPLEVLIARMHVIIAETKR